MLIEEKRKGIFQVTLSGYELAALMSAARWVAEGAKGKLSDEAVEQLGQVVANFDKARSQGAFVSGTNENARKQGLDI